MAVVASTDGKCKALALTRRGTFPLCRTHANVWDEYTRYAGTQAADTRILTGKTYAEQNINMKAGRP